MEGVKLTLRQPLFEKAISLFANATQLTRCELTENSAVPASVGKKLTDVPGVMFNADDLNVNTAQGVYGSYDRRTVVDVKLAYR